MRGLVVTVASVLGALLLVSFAGRVHPAGDSFAVLRLPLAAAFALVVIWAQWPAWLRWPLALLAIAAMVQVVWPLMRPAPQTAYDFQLYQQNLQFRRSADVAFVAHLRAVRSEVVTLQEVSGRNMALLETLKADFPQQHVCPFATVGGVAVLSRWPVSEARCADRDGLAMVRVETGQGPLWVVSVHLHWPWPYGQAAQLERILPHLETLEGPVVVAGDFNAVRWSHAVRQVAAASGAQLLGPFGKTFDLPMGGAPIGIDHVLARGVQGAALVTEKLGSDHHGVVARLSFTR